MVALVNPNSRQKFTWKKGKASGWLQLYNHGMEWLIGCWCPRNGPDHGRRWVASAGMINLGNFSSVHPNAINWPELIEQSCTVFAVFYNKHFELALHGPTNWYCNCKWSFLVFWFAKGEEGFPPFTWLVITVFRMNAFFFRKLPLPVFDLFWSKRVWFWGQRKRAKRQQFKVWWKQF